MNLNICAKRQQILNSQGHGLVLGGPGSGKTTLALLKAVTRMKEGLAPGQKILFLSFSRAAVARIADAAKEHVPHEQMNAISIQTFHSFFWAILQGHAYLLGAPKRLSIVAPHDEKAMCGGVDRDNDLWKDWEKKRYALFHKEGKVCFDLFAPLTEQLLTKSLRIRHAAADIYPLILVDEAQDTSDEQWECVRLLSEKTKVICLADPDQMIYDHLPGVNPQRIEKIKGALTPTVIDLEGENNRSPNTEISLFAKHVFHGKAKATSYKGVSVMNFRSNAAHRNKAIRRSVGFISAKIKAETGVPPKSIAIISSYGRGVAMISAALQSSPPIQHQVLFDEAFALLSSRVVAFLLEPKLLENLSDDAGTLLEMTATAFRAKGTATALRSAEKCMLYANRCRSGKKQNIKIVEAAIAIISSCQKENLTGIPQKDWLTIKQKLRGVNEPHFLEMTAALEYLVAFAKGDRIAENLSSLWLRHGLYINARQALDAALNQNQLFSDNKVLHGIHVMNWHKCKGKQFEGLILFRESHSSPFAWRNEPPPHLYSRRLLHMAITRAQRHVLILDDVSSDCPILQSFNL